MYIRSLVLTAFAPRFGSLLRVVREVARVIVFALRAAAFAGDLALLGFVHAREPATIVLIFRHVVFGVNARNVDLPTLYQRGAEPVIKRRSF
jgi:hypothetical protein